LTEIINTTHVNRKYLPNVKLPENVVAIPDIGEAVKGATALVFVMPHQCELSQRPKMRKIIADHAGVSFG